MNNEREQSTKTNTGTQIPHSGVGGTEVPKVPSDTNLSEVAHNLTTPSDLGEGFASSPLDTGEIALVGSVVATPDVSSIRIPESTRKPDTKEKSKTPLIIGGGFGAVALLATGLVLGHASANNNTPAPNTQPTSIAQETPGAAVAAPVETSTPKPTTIPGETVGTNQEVLVQITSIEAMDAMTLNDFAKLPLADRAAYAYAKAPAAHVAGENEALDPELVVGYWQDLLNEGVWTKDKAVGEKIISAIYQSPVDSQTGEFTMSYKAITKLVDELSGSNMIMNDLYNYQTHGSTLVDPESGKTYTNVTFDMVDNGGAVMSQTETDQVFEDIVKLSDGRTVKVFTQGKGVLGQNSPIPANQY